MKPASPYLTPQEAAEYLLFHKTAPTNPVKAFHQWRYRHASRLKVCRRGGSLLFKQCDLDAAVAPVGPIQMRRAG